MVGTVLSLSLNSPVEEFFFRRVIQGRRRCTLKAGKCTTFAQLLSKDTYEVVSSDKMIVHNNETEDIYHAGWTAELY